MDSPTICSSTLRPTSARGKLMTVSAPASPPSSSRGCKKKYSFESRTSATSRSATCIYNDDVKCLNSRTLHKQQDVLLKEQESAISRSATHNKQLLVTLLADITFENTRWQSALLLYKQREQACRLLCVTQKGPTFEQWPFAVMSKDKVT